VITQNVSFSLHFLIIALGIMYPKSKGLVKIPFKAENPKGVP